MNFRTIVVLMLALVCGVSAAIAVTQIQPASATVEVEAETTPVVTAAIDIPRGSALSGDVMVVSDWPKDRVPDGAFENLEEIEGQSVVIPLLQGEPILRGKVSEGRGVASLIKPGMRAFTISTPTVSSKVAGLLMPGNFVDVIWTQTRRDDEFSGGASAMTLLQQVEIFATDHDLETDAGKGKQGDPKVQSVTLAVTEPQAKMLSLAESQGTLNLALRRDDEERDRPSGNITLNDLRRLPHGVSTGERIAAMASFIKELVPERPEEDPVEEEPEVEEPASPPPPTWVRIRTIRGRSSGQVNLQLYGNSQVADAGPATGTKPPAVEELGQR